MGINKKKMKKIRKTCKNVHGYSEEINKGLS